MRKQQAEYLQGKMETCQQELRKLEVQQTVLASHLLTCRNTSFLQEPPAICVCQAAVELQRSAYRRPTERFCETTNTNPGKIRGNLRGIRAKKPKLLVGEADL